jgi:hypothetical protein
MALIVDLNILISDVCTIVKGIREEKRENVDVRNLKETNATFR